MSRRSIVDEMEPIDFLTRAPAADPEPGPGNGHRTPHERGRKGRKITVTLPSADWRGEIAAEAMRCGVRVCDIVTYAFSFYRAAVERGEIARPRGEVEIGQRAGDSLDLPWRPS